MTEEKKLNEHSDPYIEYPGAIRTQQELDRMKAYLAAEPPIEQAKLPYNNATVIGTATQVLKIAFNSMYSSRDIASLKRHSRMAIVAASTLNNLAILTEDFLQVAINEKKELRHSNTLACGCLKPEEELPF